MNRDRIEGNWKQIRGNVRKHWGMLCGNPLDVIIGKREQLTGKIQEIYVLKALTRCKRFSNGHANKQAACLFYLSQGRKFPESCL